VASISKGRLFAEKTLFLPRDDMGDANFNRYRAPWAHVFLCRVRNRNVLDNERFAASQLRTATARGSIELEGHMFVAFRTIAPRH
jgi:hypothetical protein